MRSLEIVFRISQVTKEDEERALTCMGGCSGHGECKAFWLHVEK